MNREITLAQYRTVDMILLAVFLAVSEFLIYAASSFWFVTEAYVVTPVAAITAIVMMRWSGWAGLHALFGGLFFAALHGASAQQYVIYGLGNLACMAALLFFRIYDKETIRKNSFLALVFALCVQLLMLLGRAGVAAVLGYEPAVCIGFITTDILSALFTMVIIWIVRRIEGLFEDQKHYLLRTQSEQTTEGREQF